MFKQDPNERTNAMLALTKLQETIAFFQMNKRMSHKKYEADKEYQSAQIVLDKINVAYNSFSTKKQVINFIRDLELNLELNGALKDNVQLRHDIHKALEDILIDKALDEYWRAQYSERYKGIEEKTIVSNQHSHDESDVLAIFKSPIFNR